MLAASILRIPAVIHEQNSVLGKANRVLAPYVNAIAITYENTQRMPRAPRAQIHCTGNPIRSAVQALSMIDYPELRGDGMLKILVIGGSQGASVFSETVPEAMELLPAALRARIRLDQQCRAGELDATREVYTQLGMQVDLAPFFIDVAARLASAHLVIARSGASTVAELTAAGRPAILVPYPKATDNHQYFNAQAVEDAGGGWVMGQDGFTPQALAARIETYLTNSSVLAQAAMQMRTLGKPDAASRLMEVVLGVANASRENVAGTASLA
jgi:UDP-N-acetylglucosamine--N-acetylmuramyl-(pentapeptide) pyrophosphoryl-undecaprenol N-acetylglucosamine transferase